MKKLLICLIVLSVLMVGCTKEEKLNIEDLRLGGDTWVKTELDNWLDEHFTVPYNIQVKYKWDRSEVNMDKTLVPPLESKVKPVMEAMEHVWIKPYVAVKGETFMKVMSQKQFVLVGSPEYNSNGTIVLGQAEGGKKVTLFVVNNFEKSNKVEVKRMLKTMHHEFGHILHQKKMFTPAYALITPDGYDATWFNYEDDEVLELGFISAYARNTVEDDFVEMLAIMLTDGKTAFEARVNSAGPGTAALRAKEAIIRSYLKETWDIDLDQLQTVTQEAINSLK
ncbi:zinc-binding metallopeptidase [Sphingobacterium puteale]|uniref:zinc-binding metallopeptidase n=1 Tax=Sphingobacterium puteale TaxID=2420510 RepID=UPI003D962DF1